MAHTVFKGKDVMKTFLISLFIVASTTVFATLNVAVSYPYIGAITQEIGEGKVNVNVLAKGNWDPHFVVARPSLISKLRRSDALIINGAQLEIGWIPPLIKRANNRNILPRTKGFLDLSGTIDMLDKPASVSRAGGDVHPDGNPHFHLDPNNILLLAHAITGFLVSLDPANRSHFENNFKTFKTLWKQKMQKWSDTMALAKNKRVIEYHRNFDYFLKAYGAEGIATIEPLPGIPPSSRHTMELINIIKTQKPCCIVHDVYHSTKTATYLNDKTGIKVIIMPHDIGALDSIESLSQLFDYLTSQFHD